MGLLADLWRRLTGGAQAVELSRDRAIVNEFLDPGFLRSQLEVLQKEAGKSLSGEQYDRMFAELDAGARSKVSGADPTQGDQAYLPRSPAISALQSTLTACVLSRAEDLVKPLPRGHRSFAEFELREEDVFRKFGPCDADWIESVIAKGLSLFDGPPKFVDKPPTVPLADDARIVVVGDWGTGLPGARDVARQMAEKIREAKRARREVHALHLGDLYYSGWKEEYKARFMPFWPVRSADEGVQSWALNGNHDMYSAGHGYFGYLLKDPRFAGQGGSSYFCLQNAHWQLLGLDSAYKDSDLAGNQATWVADKLRASPDRRTMLLTHHEPFSAFVEIDPPLVHTLAPAFEVRKIDAWLWGHEHLCCVYNPDLHPYLGFGSCIGHGGVPVLLPEKDLQRDGVKWRFDGVDVHENDDRWQLFGFAVLDFDGPAIEIRYFDQKGSLNHTERIG